MGMFYKNITDYLVSPNAKDLEVFNCLAILLLNHTYDKNVLCTQVAVLFETVPSKAKRCN
jgi:hypothetical protein